MQWDWRRLVFDHVALRVRDLAASRAFYETVLEPLGLPILLEDEHSVQFPNFVLTLDGPPSERVHVAFVAREREQVHAFHSAGLDAGYADNGAPGVRPYGPPVMEYYSAYLLDPDGHNVEAVLRTFPQD
jgi:catechol 2,3-dioxygenase-like lactoylglutathione lyase family enzyme